MWQCLRSWQREGHSFGSKGISNTSGHWGARGWRRHRGCKAGRLSAAGRGGGHSQSQLEAGGEPRPWPRVRLEQGSSVPGFENTPGNVLLDFSIYPEDNAF